MPGVYRKKNCPHCGIEHRGRGLFCSKACSNSNREVKPETKEKVSEKMKEFKLTPEGIAGTKKFLRDVETHKKNIEKRANGEYVLQEDDWYVLPPSDDIDDDDIRL